MGSIRTIALGNRIIDLYKFTGEVVDEKKWSTTNATGSGGGYNAGSGQSNPVMISSVSVTHDQFFLKNEDGKEISVEVVNGGLALRKEHHVTIFWAIIKGQTQGTYVAAYNHTTKTSTIFDSSVHFLGTPPTTNVIMLVWVISILAICLYGLGIIALIVLTVMRRRQKREWQTTLRIAVERAVAEAGGC